MPQKKNDVGQDDEYIEEKTDPGNTGAANISDMAEPDADANKSLVNKLKAKINKDSQPDDEGDEDSSNSEAEAAKKKRSRILQIVIGLGLVFFLASDYIIPTEEPAPAPVESKERPKRQVKTPEPTPVEVPAETPPVEAAPEIPAEASIEAPLETAPAADAPSETAITEPAVTEPSLETPASTQASPAVETSTLSETPMISEEPLISEPVETPKVETTPETAPVAETPAITETPGETSEVTTTTTVAPNETKASEDNVSDLLSTPETQAPDTGMVTGTDTVDETKTAEGDNVTEKILLDLENKVKTESKAKKTEYTNAPDYEYRGRGLVYNCTGKHWACVDGPSYKSCEDNYSSVKHLKKKIECYPFNVYQTVNGCVGIQNRMISSNAKTEFCKEN